MMKSTPRGESGFDSEAVAKIEVALKRFDELITQAKERFKAKNGNEASFEARAEQSRILSQLLDKANSVYESYLQGFGWAQNFRFETDGGKTVSFSGHVEDGITVPIIVGGFKNAGKDLSQSVISDYEMANSSQVSNALIARRDVKHSEQGVEQKDPRAEAVGRYGWQIAAQILTEIRVIEDAARELGIDLSSSK